MITDVSELKQYNFSELTKNDIKDFIAAKEAYLKEPNEDTRYEMLYVFQLLHTSLKKECSAGEISPDTLEEITNYFKKVD